MNIDKEIDQLKEVVMKSQNTIRLNDTFMGIPKVILEHNAYGFKFKVGDYVIDETDDEFSVGIIEERIRRERQNVNFTYYEIRMKDGEKRSRHQEDLDEIYPAKKALLQGAISDFLKKLNEIQKIQEPKNEQQ